MYSLPSLDSEPELRQCMRSVGKQVFIAWLVVFDPFDLGPKAKPGVVHHYKSIGVFIVCVHQIYEKR